MKVQKRLFELQDRDYALFQAKLTPTVEQERFIGVRVPILRSFAKEYKKDEEHESFLNCLPHEYYDEDMLHALLLSEIKDMDICIREVNRFLPYVDNWAVCDIMSPKVFKKNKPVLLDNIRIWSKSEHTYTCRFGLEMLMTYFLDEDFDKEYLEIPIAATSDEYYVKMMVAWFFATALAKQWEDTVFVIENHCLANWTHNKTIQKACESYRITEEQKRYLKTLKSKDK